MILTVGKLGGDGLDAIILYIGRGGVIRVRQDAFVLGVCG